MLVDRPVWLRSLGVGVPMLGGAIVLLLLACSSNQPEKPPATFVNTTLMAVDLNSTQEPVAIDGSLKMSAAKNEWTSFAVEIQHPHFSTVWSADFLQLWLKKTAATASRPAIFAPVDFTVYQVLDLPVDCRGAAYVRQTGLATGLRQLPRALLPLPMDNGRIDVSSLRDPDHPTDPRGRVTEQSSHPLVLWIDLHVPAEFPPGDYTGSCDLMTLPANLGPLAATPFALHVYDFAIPDERHLKLVSPIPWDPLTRLYADQLKAITPRLLNRNDPRYTVAVKTLDDLVTLAQRHRVEAVVPRLQPTVKWPADQPPEVDWSDFDSLVGPWFDGQGFADKTPLGYWPLPAIDYLDNYDAASRQQYWSAATAHFTQKNWPFSTSPTTTRPTPIAGGGDENDVRLCAWQAMLKHDDMVLLNSPLPNQQNPTQAADPGELIWFYPGAWFGADGSVPSIQLKWLRRTQQDYEYFYLASQHGMAIPARQIARSMANLVDLPGQASDPIYALFGGDADHHAWTQARELLARAVLAHPTDSNFNLDLVRWLELRASHVILPRATQWSWDADAPPGENWAKLTLGVDVYNGGEDRHDAAIRWQATGPGWEFSPAPLSLGILPSYAVQRATLPARINLDKLSAATRQPLQLLYVDTFTQKEYPATAYLPVAASDRREAGLKLSDDLSGWTSDDLLHDGKMIQFYSRPAIQHHQIDLADTASQIYSAWADENFCLAFKLNGITAANTHHTNIPEYQLGRAWGEDLCEVLVQAVYADNTTGPVLHVVCKPTGAIWAESKKDSAPDVKWEALEGAPIRYATNAEKEIWTGELAIDWRTLSSAAHAPPAKPKLLRFNFSQHRQATGESASWAGPIDSGRDDTCTGLIFLRDNAAPGMREKLEGR